MSAAETCPSCGHVNAPGSNFCSSCGTRLSDDERTISFQPAELGVEGPSTEIETTPPEHEEGAILVVKRGPNAGSRFTLDSSLTRIGRHPDSDIFLDDITVSRRHVEVERQDDSYVARDVGSLNGTYVNRERVEEASLNNGDELQVGRFKLVFFVGPEE